MKPILVVVDDESDIREGYRDYFSDEFEVYSYAHPTDLITELKKGGPTPDLVITDFKMDGISGVELMQQLRAMGLESPILLLSGFVEKDVALEAVEQGVFAILEKPVDFVHLRQVVHRMLLEVELEQLRGEIRHQFLQLREVFDALAEVVFPMVDQKILDRLFIQAEGDEVKAKLNPKQVIAQLESQIDRLLDAEKKLMQLKRRGA
ncbi:MAG: response regulator [Bdellovibrionaceae bacterium]|jgi:FixJ family two-component response regulator|nr:response regulator [Pseudobdellovibrionaceae bacterium]